MIKETPGYQAIERFYGDRRAERSQVLLIDHIDQGIEILRRYGSDEVVMEAYAVHPLFQANPDLEKNFYLCDDLHPLVVLYAMEYRNIANSFLSGKVQRKRISGWGDPSDQCDWEAYPIETIKLSPLQSVNEMLVADKVQNRKDFIRYHKDSHARSLELDFYFKYWLNALGISESRYEQLSEGL
jgi:hypothetical protein